MAATLGPVCFEGKVHWDPSKPEGQPAGRLDTSRVMDRFDWEAATQFEEGLQETIEWYEFHRDEIDRPLQRLCLQLSGEPSTARPETL